MVMAVSQVASVGGRFAGACLADRVLPAPHDARAARPRHGPDRAIATLAAGPGWPPWLLFVFAAVFGATAVGWNGVFLAEVARLAPQDRIGEATGGLPVLHFPRRGGDAAAFNVALSLVGELRGRLRGVRRAGAAGRRAAAALPAPLRGSPSDMTSIADAVLVHGLWVPGLVMLPLAGDWRGRGFRMPLLRLRGPGAAARRACRAAAALRFATLGRTRPFRRPQPGRPGRARRAERPPRPGGRTWCCSAPRPRLLLGAAPRAPRLGPLDAGRERSRSGRMSAAGALEAAEPLGVVAGTSPIGLGRVLGRLPGPNDGVVRVEETTRRRHERRTLGAARRPQRDARFGAGRAAGRRVPARGRFR